MSVAVEHIRRPAESRPDEIFSWSTTLDMLLQQGLSGAVNNHKLRYSKSGSQSITQQNMEEYCILKTSMFPNSEFTDNPARGSGPSIVGSSIA